MSEYKLSYNISKDDVDKFLSRVIKACRKYLFTETHTINEINNGTVIVKLVITATPSTCAHILSHDNMLMAIYYWNDDIMYNIFA
jgi:hypothetical protein